MDFFMQNANLWGTSTQKFAPIMLTILIRL